MNSMRLPTPLLWGKESSEAHCFHLAPLSQQQSAEELSPCFRVSCSREGKMELGLVKGQLGMEAAQRPQLQCPRWKLGRAVKQALPKGDLPALEPILLWAYSR